MKDPKESGGIPSNALELLPERWAVKVDKGHERWKEWSEWYNEAMNLEWGFTNYAYGCECIGATWELHRKSILYSEVDKSLCPIWTLDEFYQYLTEKTLVNYEKAMWDKFAELHEDYIKGKLQEARQYTSEFIEELTKDIKGGPMVTLTKEYESAYVFVESENASARIEISINLDKKTFQLSTPSDETVDFDNRSIEEAELLIVAQQKAIEYIKERFKQE